MRGRGRPLRPARPRLGRVRGLRAAQRRGDHPRRRGHVASTAGDLQVGTRVTAGPGNTVFCVQDSPEAGQHAAAEHGAVREHERSMGKVHIIANIKYLLNVHQYILKYRL